MNIRNKLPLVRQGSAPVGKGELLPIKATITVPGLLDWVVKRQLSVLILRCRMHTATTHLHLDDLLRLEAAIGPQDRTSAYQVSLYGYELKTLRTFLLEHEEAYAMWAPHIVPLPVYWPVRAVLRQFLTKLDEVCPRIDLYANRPVPKLNLS